MTLILACMELCFILTTCDICKDESESAHVGGIMSATGTAEVIRNYGTGMGLSEIRRANHPSSQVEV